jgi:hypothetical protein
VASVRDAHTHAWTVATTAVAVAMLGWLGIDRIAAQPPLDTQLKTARETLLASYGAFKNYGISDPMQVYSQKLSADRQALFDAILRAAFVEIQRDGKPNGPRVISLVEGVRGIWGVRPGEKEGRRMFRMSVRFKAGARTALTGSSNIPRSISGHVLLPVAKGGDDDPTFAAFDVKTNGVETFRQSGSRPNIQISLLTSDERTGEIDLDFDSGCGPWPIRKCHCRPANSDVGSHTSSEDHTAMFNQRVALFSAPLASTWSNTVAHCKESY